MSYQKDKLFASLLREEQSFFSKEFLSPIYNSPVTVKITGITLTMKVVPADFLGWGVFRTADGKVAELVREASEQERKSYLELFPRVAVMICNLDPVLAVGISGSISFSGVVPVLLSDNIQLFDVVFARYTGKNLWFEGVNRRYPRRTSAALRKSLEDKSRELNIDGISDKERAAYAFALNQVQPTEEEQMQNAIRRAGGNYLGYKKQGGSYIVRYTVDGQEHSSRVSHDLKVESAGICLQDHNTHEHHDSDFDLQSLVGVIREGYDTGQIVRVGLR